MRKQLVTIMTILLVAVFALSACGPAATPTEPPPEPTEAPPEPTDAPEPTEVPEEPEPTEVPEEPTEEPELEPLGTIRIWADDTRSAILLNLADDFFETYQVEVIVEEVANIRDQFIISAPAGEGPDIIIGAHDWIGALIASGLLAPVDLGPKAGEFTDVSLAGFAFDGQLYGMPYATENLAFFYNADLVETPPTTWAEMIEIGQALVDDGQTTYAFALTGTTYDMFPLHTSFGGYIFGQDADGNWNPSDVGVDSQGMIDAVAWTREQIEAGLMPESTDWDSNHTLFETGETPFLMAGPWALERIRASGVNYAITTFPDAGRPFAGVQGFMINAFNTDNVLLAQAFLTEFVATPEVMTELQVAGGRASAFASVAADAADPDLALFSTAGADASLMPSIPEMGSVWAAWNDGVTLALQGEQTADESLANAGIQVRDLIAGALAGMINVPGSYQALVGCGGDWDPACPETALVEQDDGTFSITSEVPAGEYEFKVALDGSWAVNYGSDGMQDGPNYTLALDADSTVTVVFDPETNLLTITTE